MGGENPSDTFSSSKLASNQIKIKYVDKRKK